MVLIWLDLIFEVTPCSHARGYKKPCNKMGAQTMRVSKEWKPNFAIFKKRLLLSPQSDLNAPVFVFPKYFAHCHDSYHH